MIDFRTELDQRIRAGYSAVWVRTAEEDYVLEVLAEVCKARQANLKYWSSHRGLVAIPTQKDLETQALESALARVRDETSASSAGRTVYVLLDAHSELTIPQTGSGTLAARALRDTISPWANPSFRKAGHCLIVISPVITIPLELKQELELLEFPRPDRLEIEKILDSIVKSVENSGAKAVRCSKEIKDQLVEAALGMTRREAENAFSLACVRQHGLNGQAVQTVYDEKGQQIRKSQCLQLRTPTETGGLARIGGMENVKTHVRLMRNRLTPEAQAFGCPPPKGILLVGIPGTGKSLISDMISLELGLPLIDFDLTRVFGGIVGQSEAQTHEAVEIINAMSPCVVRMDDADKRLSGTGSSNLTDAGTTDKVSGILMTWLQERQGSVFVIATMNDVARVPEGFLRSGRFDSIFGVDVPTTAEREAICKILLQNIRQKPRDPDKFDLTRLVSESKDYTGAEIETGITHGLDLAFSAGQELNTSHIVEGLSRVMPILKIDPERMRRIHEWVAANAKPAGLPEAQADIGVHARRVER